MPRLLLVVLLVLFAAACGGDDDDGDEDGSGGSSQSTATSDDSDAEGEPTSTVFDIFGSSELDPYVYMSKSGGEIADGTLNWAFIVEQGDDEAVKGVTYKVDVYSDDTLLYSTEGTVPTIQPMSRVGVWGHTDAPDADATVTEVKVEFDGGEFIPGKPAPVFDISMGFDDTEGTGVPHTGEVSLKNLSTEVLENQDLVIICEYRGMIIGGGSAELPEPLEPQEEIRFPLEVWCSDLDSSHMIFVPIEQ